MAGSNDSGRAYSHAIARYLAASYRGVRVYEEVPLGMSTLGRRRRVDVLVVQGDRALVLQAKYQSSNGTADEKIPHALADCEAMYVPAAVVYGGRGWSPGVLALLRSSRFAVACDLAVDGALGATDDLDAYVAQIFGLWDVLLSGRDPVR